MKKTLLVVAVAAILILAFSSAAFAAQKSGQQRFGNAATAGAPVGGVGSNPASNTAGAGTYTYIDWATGLGTNNSGISAGANSPHGAYTTTTVKCAVCHAVHYAAPGNAPVGSVGNTADTLLRMKASDACSYCHVVAGGTVNGRSVYNGVMVDDANSGGDQNSGHATGDACGECHTSVHGSNADTSVPSVVGYLLKKSAVSATQPYTSILARIQAIDATAVVQGFATASTLSTVTGFDESAWTNPANNGALYREAAVGLFCIQCHEGSYAQTQDGASANVNMKAGPRNLSGHRVQASAETTWTGHSSGSYNGKGQIAWADAANCKSCHDSKDTLGNAGFPHAWGGTKMWLVAAPSATEATEALPFGAAPNTDYNVNKPQLSDGVCLKCHRDNSTTAGVGLSY